MPHGIVVFVGIVTFIAFLTEGATMDWSGVFLTEMRGLDTSLAGTGFAIFSAAMLLMRLIGDGVVNRFGQKSVVICGSALGMLGFLGVIFAPSTFLLYLSFFLSFFAVGAGSANVVPVFFSLLGKQDVMPVALAVSAVGTFGYLGILAGPAIIGFIAHATNLGYAFVFLAALLAVQGLLAWYVYRTLEK